MCIISIFTFSTIQRQLVRVQEQSGAAGEPPEVPPPRGHRAAAARGQAHSVRHPEAGGGCLSIYLYIYLF